MTIPRGAGTLSLVSLAGAALLYLMSGHVVSGQEADRTAAAERGRLLARQALEAADRAWDDGHLDFSMMEDYLAGLVQAQLEDDGLT